MSRKSIVVAVYSAIGAQGVTFTAIQLAHQFSKSGKCCLIDLNLDLSVALLYLNQDAQSAFRKSAISNSDANKISDFAISVAPNYYAVGFPMLGYGHFAEDVEESMKELLDQCKTEFDFIVIDLPHPHHVDLTKVAMLKSDIVIYLTADSPQGVDAATNFKLLLQSPRFKQLSGKEIFVLNHKTLNRQTNAAELIILTGLLGFLALSVVLAKDTSIEILEILSALALLVILRLAYLVARQQIDCEKKLKQNAVAIFHELPCDHKGSMLATNKGSFLDEKGKLFLSYKSLAEKIRERTATKVT